jgi:uncharacterized protein
MAGTLSEVPAARSVARRSCAARERTAVRPALSERHRGQQSALVLDGDRPVGDGPRSAPLTGGVVDSVARLGADADRLLRGRSYWASARWLACAEELPGHDFRYLCVRSGGRLVGVLPCQYVAGTGGPRFYDIPGMVHAGGVFGSADHLDPTEAEQLDQARAAMDPASLYPSLIAASPNSCCPVGLDPDLGDRDRRLVLAALVRLHAETADQAGCRSRGLLYLYPEPDPAVSGVLADICAAAGLQRVRLGADCVLPVDTTGFTGYLDRFRSARRVAIRRERRRFAEAGLTVRVERGPAALRDEFVELQDSLLRRYGSAADRPQLLAGYQVLRRWLGDELVVFTAWQAETLVGFIAFLEHDGVLYARSTGFDHGRIADTFCYFNLLYYTPVDWAAARGITRIHYGFATYEAKLRRGCVPWHADGYLAFAGADPAPATAAGLLSRSEERRLDGLGAIAREPAPRPVRRRREQVG